MSAATPRMLVASPETLAELVSQLPAELRAQVAWAPKRVANMVHGLLTEPYLSEGLVDAAGDAYLDASQAMMPAIAALLSQPKGLELVAKSLEADLPLLKELPVHSGKAAARALLTLFVFAQAGLTGLEQLDVAELQQAARSLDPEASRVYQSIVRAGALLIAVFHGLRHGSPIPGRVASLARRADAEAQTFAVHLAAEAPALAMPWYSANAPNAEKAAAIATWNPENRFTWRASEPEPTPEEEEAWERVKASIDAARPHRKLFS